MALKYLRSFDMGTIAAGATAEATWVPNKDVHIRKIYFVERSAQTLTDVDVYVKIGEKVLTMDFAPAALFGSDPWVSIDVDIDVAKGTEIYWKVKNNKAASVAIVAVFEVTE